MPRPASIFALVCLTVPALAQTHKVSPPEKVTRAIAVYEYTGDDLTKPTAARLVPVSIFINAHLEDAGVYLPQPMPFALQSGDVYSIEKAGQSIGTLDIDYARNILPPGSTADVAAVGAWYGYGNFVPPAAPKKVAPLQASAHPVNIEGSDDDERPHFTGRQPGQPDSTPTTTTADTSNRPTMGRRDGSPDPNAPTTASSGTGTIPDDDPDRPTLRHRDPAQPKPKKEKESDSGVIPTATSLNEDPDRPTMQRGRPAALTAAPQLTTTPPDMNQLVAVSDAAVRDPHPFAREWDSPADHAETLRELEAQAQNIIAKYETTWHLTAPQLGTNSGASPEPAEGSSHSEIGPSTAAPGRPQSHAIRGPKVHIIQPTPPALALEQLTPFTLSYGGLPTFVFTAQSPIAVGGPIYVTLVSQRLPSGELQIALSSVTDAAHLDRTPWLRFIDAVDPDWSHRASLLFELRAQNSRQFALYSLTTAHAEQAFATTPIQ